MSYFCFVSFWPIIALIIYSVIFWRKYSFTPKLIAGIVISILSIGTYYGLILLLGQLGGSFSSVSDNTLTTIIFIIFFLIPILYSILAHGLFFQSDTNANNTSSKKTKPEEIKTVSPFTISPPLLHSSNIFICYRRSDSNNITGRIYDRLRQYYGKEFIFKDVDSIPLGVDFRVFIDDVISKCQVLLVVIGNQWLSSVDNSGSQRLDNAQDYVRIEIASALKRNIPVIPLLVQDAIMPTEANLPTEIKELSYRNGISIRHDPDFHNDMNRLIKNLNIIRN